MAYFKHFSKNKDALSIKLKNITLKISHLKTLGAPGSSVGKVSESYSWDC